MYTNKQVSITNSVPIHNNPYSYLNIIIAINK